MESGQLLVSATLRVLDFAGSTPTPASQPCIAVRRCTTARQSTTTACCSKISTWAGRSYSLSNHELLRTSMDLRIGFVGIGGRENVFIASGLSRWSFVEEWVIVLALWPVLMGIRLVAAGVLLAVLASSLLLSMGSGRVRTAGQPSPVERGRPALVERWPNSRPLWRLMAARRLLGSVSSMIDVERVPMHTERCKVVGQPCRPVETVRKVEGVHQAKNNGQPVHRRRYPHSLCCGGVVLVLFVSGCSQAVEGHWDCETRKSTFTDTAFIQCYTGYLNA